MGLFDLPGPLFGLIDGALDSVLPDVLRLALWGVLAGWLTMLVYRRLSNQEKIQALKSEQKTQQKEIAEFDGEMSELFPLIRHTLGLGMRQLGLSLGPALLATIPILFLLVWVAGHFGHELPAAGDRVAITLPNAQQTISDFDWQPRTGITVNEAGWEATWPTATSPLQLLESGQVLLQLPVAEAIPVIHKKRWWNSLMANPIGYLPDNASVDVVELGFTPQVFLPFGPGWMSGWMFTFFTTFLLSSIAFKLLLRID